MNIKRGQIYLANLGKHIENIQKGQRPVIIIQNNKGNKYSKSVIICPITSIHKNRLRTHLDIGKSGGLHRNSTILCEQITTIPIYNLKRYIGTVNNKVALKKLNKCIRIALGIPQCRKQK